MIVALLNIQIALPYVSLACWRWATVAFAAMVGIATISSVSSRGVSISNLAYMASFMIRPTWPCFPPSTVVGRVVVLAYNYRIVSFKDSLSGSPLIVGRLLKTNLATTSSIVFGFGIIDIVVFSFFIRTALLALSFVGIVVDYCTVFIQLGLKILLVDRRHMLLTLT